MLCHLLINRFHQLKASENLFLIDSDGLGHAISFHALNAKSALFAYIFLITSVQKLFLFLTFFGSLFLSFGCLFALVTYWIFLLLAHLSYFGEGKSSLTAPIPLSNIQG